MTRRNRPTRNPQRRKGMIPVRAEKMLQQLFDDAQAAIVYMGDPRN